MRSRRAPFLHVGLVAMTALAACGPSVATLTGEKADWAYVQQAWGGITLGEPRVSGDELRLPIGLDVTRASRADSAICACDTRAVRERAILRIALRKCVCGPDAVEEPVASLTLPPAGTYQVVYDDAAAGYPLLGTVRVP